ncbi:MAG: tyrosine-type recombinase/integrase [Alphaproteobacteria bacterium]
MSNESTLAQTRKLLQQRNHPKKGASIKVEPIRLTSAIMAINEHLQDQPRNLCLFILGINTAYRAGELLSLRVADVSHLKVGDILEIKQLKNHKYRQATLNGAAYHALNSWLAVHPNPTPSAYLFLSQRGGAITVSTLCNYMKLWCSHAGLNGNFGSHTLRKTWGFHQRTMNKDADVSLLMRAFGHASEAQTLSYLGIQPKEVRDLYLEVELPMRQIVEEEESAQDTPISTRLLSFQDELNRYLSMVEYHLESMHTMFEGDEGIPAMTGRKIAGLHHTNRVMVETGSTLSKNLNDIRTQITALTRDEATSATELSEHEQPPI